MSTPFPSRDLRPIKRTEGGSTRSRSLTGAEDSSHSRFRNPLFRGTWSLGHSDDGTVRSVLDRMGGTVNEDD